MFTGCIYHKVCFLTLKLPSVFEKSIKQSSGCSCSLHPHSAKHVLVAMLKFRSNNLNAQQALYNIITGIQSKNLFR